MQKTNVGEYLVTINNKLKVTETTIKKYLKQTYKINEVHPTVWDNEVELVFSFRVLIENRIKRNDQVLREF